VLRNELLNDGHNRNSICQNQVLPFNTIQDTQFKSMDDVHLWMIDQHLGRRSVSDFQRGVLALRKREIIATRRAAAAAAVQAAKADAPAQPEGEAPWEGETDPVVAAALASVAKVPDEALDTREALARVQLVDKLFARCDQLSGGQLQRVGIARVLYQQAELILADEPVASLDPKTARSVLQYLREATRELGIAVVCNLHQVDYAREFGDRVLGLAQGRLVYDGTPAGLDEEALQAIYPSGAAAPHAGTGDAQPAMDMPASRAGSWMPAPAPVGGA
jgi:ABC-type dipeptide/oligopeptide/nickel transport system ATPase component